MGKNFLSNLIGRQNMTFYTEFGYEGFFYRMIKWQEVCQKLYPYSPKIINGKIYFKGFQQIQEIMDRGVNVVNIPFNDNMYETEDTQENREIILGIMAKQLFPEISSVNASVLVTQDGILIPCKEKRFDYKVLKIEITNQGVKINLIDTDDYYTLYLDEKQKNILREKVFLNADKVPDSLKFGKNKEGVQKLLYSLNTILTTDKGKENNTIIKNEGNGIYLYQLYGYR